MARLGQRVAANEFCVAGKIGSEQEAELTEVGVEFFIKRVGHRPRGIANVNCEPQAAKVMEEGRSAPNAILAQNHLVFPRKPVPGSVKNS
jgi:hypothetical protein